MVTNVVASAGSTEMFVRVPASCTHLLVGCEFCHCMIHRNRDNVLSLEPLRRIMRQ